MVVVHKLRAGIGNTTRNPGLCQEGNKLPSVFSDHLVSLSGCFTKGGGPTEAPGRRKEHREGSWGFRAVLRGLEERKTRQEKKHRNLSK